MRIYITHCSKKKDDSLKDTGKKVGPNRLYTAKPTQRFMNRCKEKMVKWAIFSDLHGVWLPNVEYEWYEKDPHTVTEGEFFGLVKDFEEKLEDHDEIYFYYNPGRFHRLYKRLISQTKLRSRITRFSHIAQII